MTEEEANDIVSALSSSTVPSTLPSTVHSEEADSPMGEGEANPVEEAGDCLSNRPASSSSRPVDNEMQENGEGCRRSHRKELIPRGTAPRHICRSCRLSEDQGQKQVQAGVIPRSFGNQQTRLPSCH